MAKKQNKTTSKRKRSSSKLDPLSVLKNKWLALVFALGVGLIGSYFVFFSSAAPNNCQNDGDIPICDVDMAGCATQTILNTNDVPQGLGKKGCLYYGAVFRAPTKPMKGTVPISRIYNSSATYHDWVTPSQKTAKEKKGYGFKVEQATSFYAWPAETRPGGTVPVYRLTRTNSNGAQAFFTTDGALVNKLLAAGANDKEGWKKNQLTASDYVAFYAYRPSYQVPGKPNPHDCSKIENYTSERCKDARENLENAIDEGKVAQTDACPANVTAYINEPFPGRFTKDCQNKWNTYMQDCSKQDNFLSNRCKEQRAAVEKAEQERKAREAAERARAEQQARAAQSSRGSSGSNSNSSNSSRTSSSGNNSSTSNTAQRSPGVGQTSAISQTDGAVDCSLYEFFVTSACKAQRDALALAQSGIGVRTAPMRERRQSQTPVNQNFVCKLNWKISAPPRGQSRSVVRHLSALTYGAAVDRCELELRKLKASDRFKTVNGQLKTNKIDDYFGYSRTAGNFSMDVWLNNN